MRIWKYSKNERILTFLKRFAPEEWVAVVKTGRVLFEVAGLDEATLREALRLASHKLPIKCKIIGKGE